MSNGGIDLIRLSLSINDQDDIEVYSCKTKTTLILPKEDVYLLKLALNDLDSLEIPRESVCLDAFL